ncbi:hypothetical protein VTN77DRAFT_4626 [Rasamsonia byssochlamydoides]|uniref:uncharacterized protein n=1 Tax=Rasamsonia byssochlamydoides TaxID=89139 RepID=UPI003742CD2E
MSQRPKKLQRVSKACDFCNRRSIKCSKADDPLGRCQNCADFDVPCTFDRPIKRRGVKSSRARLNEAQDQRSPGVRSQSDSSQRYVRSGDPWGGLSTLWSATDNPSRDENALRRSWSAFAIATERTIRNLVQVYFEIVYPIFPLFHRPSFLERLDRNEHLRDRGFFASTMAACALASGRARDGALYSTRWHLSELLEPPSEVFYAAAKDSIPKDLSTAKGLNFMRACAILAIASIQNGQIKAMQQYTGYYHTLTAMEGLYDEKLWPKQLTPIEIEERRRLFWSIYTLDIYSSIVWGGIIRHREAQSMVRYPTEIDDEYITETGYSAPPAPASNTSTSGIPVVSHEPVSWLRGWNFTTDLYRILEHAVDNLRCRWSQQNGMTRFHSLFGRNPMTESVVMEQVLAMYSALPSQFRETLPVTGDPAKDLFGFQSANIQATLQLLRMVLFSSEDIGVERKCDVAGELLSVFSKVPVEYLKAISSPLLHHLAGIGYILGSVIEGSLSESSYQRVRMLLLEMADLLCRLESGLRRAAGASERLRTQVDRIDEYMRQQRMMIAAAQQQTNVLGQQQQQHQEQPEARTVPSLPYNQTGAFGEQLSQFQLPPELLEDWPWPFDSGPAEGLLPLNFD